MYPDSWFLGRLVESMFGVVMSCEFVVYNKAMSIISVFKFVHYTVLCGISTITYKCEAFLTTSSSLSGMFGSLSIEQCTY